MTGTRGFHEAARAPVKGLVPKEREGDRLLAPGWNAGLVHDSEVRARCAGWGQFAQRVRERAHERRVARAAAARPHARWPSRGVVTQRPRDGARSERGRGGEKVRRREAALGQGGGVMVAEALASRALGWRRREPWVGEQRAEQRIVRSARIGQFATGVECEALSARERVEDAVAGSGVPGNRFLHAAGRHEGEVRHAADVEDGHVAGRIGEDEGVEKGDERRALAAGGDVAGPQIGDDRAAEPLGQDRRLADLEGGDRGAGVVDAVMDRLAVRDDEVKAARGDAGASEGCEQRIGKGGADFHVRAGQLAEGHRDLRIGHPADDPVAQGAGPRLLGREQNLELQHTRLVSGVDLDDGDVDRVDGCAAHEAGDAHQCTQPFSPPTRTPSRK